MPQTLRFHLDENVAFAVAQGLRLHKIDVTTTPEAGLRGATDERQVEFARSAGRVIFTQDDDFLKLHAAGVPHPGIVFCEQNRRSIGEIIWWLRFIWEALEASDMQSQVEFI